jgi:polynucleotide 5'-kinase involved in rRNA processing
VARTLLIGSPEKTWRSWLKENRGERDLLILDPSDPDHGHLARLVLLRGDKVVQSRFYGSLDASRAPHVLIASLAQMLPSAAENTIVQIFQLHGGPILRHTVLLLSQLVQPEEILVPQDSPLDLEGFPVGPHEVELEASFPETVRSAQRKANWLKLLERCEEHEVHLNHVAVEGARLGSGRKIKPEQLAKVGITDVPHAEVSGGTLFLITDEEPSDQSLSRGLDVFHCGRAHVVQPGSYNGLLCSFARQSGEDFGTGVIQTIDFETKVARILCDAVAPAPVRILKIGGLRVDTAGREMGEVRPWQL